ncbi:ArgP/LysG family DNA-binding transcriptional regulator [Marinomonas spartinae]|uniref:ArgP/LysG family DNA-binding transcriptional regulator n=1 Tax=Marinomonas spartinae TaxID=1792290 RepID=UPI0018F20AAF|nr:ArgP/LysG family DNA-binding transcriptional regulator [Marinomonas spartinae]MBJ7552834.1 ArgP/LysG family DNA-binding transcriptional regulator [Marinomonas spartinae]
MLDYHSVACFCSVVRFQSFEKAAQHLNLTQSAVSQRVKRLEEQCAGPLLIRARPIELTMLGEQLLAHANKVAMLEDGLFGNLTGENARQPLSIAVNNDVLATWFSDVVTDFSRLDETRLHIKAADQGKTRELLQRGEVVACISQIGTPVSGGTSILLGYMHYELFSSPEFIENVLRCDRCKISVRSVARAPSLIYDENDELWARYVKECLGMPLDSDTSHWYPSSHGFVSMVLGGTVCALIPSIQVRQAVEAGRLVSLFPQKKLSVPVYWHWFKLNSPVLERLSSVVQKVSKRVLS